MKKKSSKAMSVVKKLQPWLLSIILAVSTVAIFAIESRGARASRIAETLGTTISKSESVKSQKEVLRLDLVTYTATPTSSPTIKPSQKATVAAVTPKPTVKATSTPKPTAPSTIAPTTITPTLSKTPTPTPKPTFDYSKPWTVAPNCPSTTLNCVPCKVGETYCRTEPNKTRGFLGWACQNNNPGNIRNSSTNMSTDFKNKIIVRNGGTAACGVRYDSRGGSYFVFSTYSAGFGSLKAYLKGINNGEHSSYAGTGWKCGDCTISQFFSKYSPSGYATYAAAVANEIGEPTSTTLRSVISKGKLDAFATAIKNFEGFYVQ